MIPMEAREIYPFRKLPQVQSYVADHMRRDQGLGTVPYFKERGTRIPSSGIMLYRKSKHLQSINMFISRLSLSQVAVSGVVLFIVYRVLSYVYWQMTTGAARRKIIREKGCKPLKRRSAKDPFFGIDILYDSATHIKKHNALQWQCDMTNRLGCSTTSVCILRNQIVITVDPKVVQTVLSLDFNSFGLGSARDGIKT